MAKQPVELMFGGYRRALLAQLLLRPGEGFHVREIGRMTAIPAGSLHRELRALSDSGLLLREHAGNQVRYQANQECPIYQELASIFRKTVGLAALVGDALSVVEPKIDLAFVFGSVSAGQHHVASDVDILIIGALSLGEVVTALSPVQKQLCREINPVVMTAEKFRSQRNKNDRFVARVMAEPKIFVIGDNSGLEKLIENQAASGA